MTGHEAQARTRIAIVGAGGRMGESLVRLVGADPELELVATIKRGHALEPALVNLDAVIDFSRHEVSGRVAQLCAARGLALIEGTTGHSQEERTMIEQAAERTPIVFAPNFSVGVNLLFHLTEIAARALGESYDREIVEMHHRHKLDAPSGTARRLGEILAEASGGTYADLVQHGRQGQLGVRPKKIIGLHALRGGDIVGDHSVRFAIDGEMIELSHRATNRDTFSIGALQAAKWAVTRPPGLYSMAQVLGLVAK